LRGYDRLAVMKRRLPLIVIVVLAGCGGGGGTTQRKTAPAPPPPPIEAKVKTFKLGGEVCDVAATPRLIWVAQRGEGRVLRLMPSGRRAGPSTRLSSRLGTLANDLAVGGPDVFLAYAGNDGRVARLDPASGRAGPALRVGRGAERLALGGGAAYTSHLTGIVRVPLTGGRARAVDVKRTPNALLYARGELWATVSHTGSILELNGSTLANENDFGAADPSEFTTTADQAAPFGMATGAGSIWIAVAADVGELVRIDLRQRHEVARIHVQTPFPFAVAFARNRIWVLDYYANTLTRVDPRTNKVTGRLTVGPPRNRDNIASRVPAAVAAQGRNLWVTDADSGTITRVELP
jgi:streptogramin lyase